MRRISIVPVLLAGFLSATFSVPAIAASSSAVDMSVLPDHLAKPYTEHRFITDPARLPAAHMVDLRLPVAKAAASHGKERSGALRIGQSMHAALKGVAKRGAEGLVWETSAQGHVAILHIRADAAAALRVGLLLSAAPADLRLRIGSRAQFMAGQTPHELTRAWMEQTYGAPPFVLWTPVTSGDEQIIEFHLPLRVDPEALAFQVADVSYLTLDPTRPLPRSSLEKDNPIEACHLNYHCATDPSITAAGRAVARLVYVDAGDSYLCSGSLLRDRNNTGTPYFATANHCFRTQTVASTLQVGWYYEQACGSSVTSTAFSTTLGSTLLVTDASNDFTFVRLTGALPAGVAFLGWDTNEVTLSQSVYGVHHPGGNPKKYSTGAIAGVGNVTSFGDGTNTYQLTVNKVNWITGLTQGGSSGSPLMTGQGVFRGALSSGNREKVCGGLNYSNYSRFTMVYPKIRTYIDPLAVTTVDDYPSNVIAITSSTDMNATLTGNLETATDQDWFRFVIPGAGYWLVGTSAYDAQAPTDTYGRIYTPEGTVVFEEDDDSSTDRNFAFAIKYTGAVTRFLQVTGFAGATGRYVLESSFVPADDHGNYRSDATTLTLGASVNGAVSYSGDRDVFKLVLASAATVNFVSSGSTDVWGYLRDVNGSYITDNDDAATGNRNFSISRQLAAGTYYLEVYGFDDSVTGSYSVLASTGSAAAANYQGAWWAGATENGWGLSFVQHGNTLVAGWYYYTGLGQPTWSIMPGCTWNAAFTSCTGNVVNSTGAWLGNYSTGPFAQNVVGTVTFTFSSTGSGTMAWTVGGVPGQKSISKLNFATGTASPDYSDVWWGGTTQNGWGVALAQQGTVLVGSWYTYNAQGQPVWYLINGGSWVNATTYSAQLTRATGSPLIGATYNASMFTPTSAGTISFTFTSSSAATMTYTVDGVTQSKAISRLAF